MIHVTVTAADGAAYRVQVMPDGDGVGWRVWVRDPDTGISTPLARLCDEDTEALDEAIAVVKRLATGPIPGDHRNLILSAPPG